MNSLSLLAAKANCKNTVCLEGLPHGQATGDTIDTIITIVLMTVAAVAILFVVIGGIRYIMSQGDPQAMAKAKGTIILAIVGLVVVIIAQALVSFVLSRLS